MTTPSPKLPLQAPAETPRKVPSAAFPFPSVDELARTAASLHPRIGADAEQSVREALRIHLNCWIIRETYAGLGTAELITELNSPELVEWMLRSLKELEALRLYPDNAVLDAATRKEFFDGDLDPARQYLYKKQAYGGWGKTRTVLHCIQLFHLDRADRHNQEHAATITKLEDLHEKMAAEKKWTVAQLRNGMEMQPEQRRRDGQRECDEFLAKCAVFEPMEQCGWNLDELRRHQKVEYWNFPKAFLDDLVGWRRSVKSDGGIKKLEKRLLRSGTKKT